MLLLSPPVRAEGWPLTSWIPGGQKETTSKRSAATRKPLLGGKSLRSTSKTSSAKEPSMWQRMTNGTGRFASRTKDALTFGGADEKSQVREPTARIAPKREEPSFWARLFNPEPRPSKTVDGFLSQKRPEEVQ
jgi:hypothetical protein